METIFEKRKRGCGIVIFKCNTCNKFMENYYVIGDTHQPHLMICSECKTIFYYDEDVEKYTKPLEEQIKNRNCPVCNMILLSTLIEYSPNNKCSTCNKSMNKIKTIKHDYRDFFEIYSDIIKT